MIHNRDLEASRGDQATACRLLWIEVILSAVREADGFVAAESRPDTKKLLMDEARDWFIRGGRNFRMVCEMAGFEPDQVRQAWLNGSLCAAAIKSSNKKDVEK